MRVSYLKIKQKNEDFYVIKFNAKELRSHLDFHFREPFTNDTSARINCDQYINELKKRGIEINDDPEGVQRRIQIGRINSIKNYLEENEETYFPNSVVLAADVSNEPEFMDEYVDNPYVAEIGYMFIPDSVSFQIVDGQHRLAGLFICDEAIQKNFEIFAVVLFNASKNICAQIFRDINGNQSPINKSGLFDLLELMNISADDKETLKDRNVHHICKSLNYEDETSPLYHHVKMMGIGKGAISQACFVQNVKRALDKCGIDISDEDNIKFAYDQLYFYFSAFRNIFYEYWPVLSKKQFDKQIHIEALRKHRDMKDDMNDDMNESKIIEFSSDYIIAREQYSEYIIKETKSQLLKTNGFGAMMELFPDVYHNIQEYDYKSYYNYLCVLKDKIDWSKDPLLSNGTGRKIVISITDKLRKMLGIKVNNIK